MVATPTTYESSPLVQWRAVFAGTAIGLATLALFAALFTALSVSSNVGFVTDYLAWFIAGSAIFAMFLGAFLAGWFSGVRGTLAGFFTGLTVWALGVLAIAAFGIQAAAHTFRFAGTTVNASIPQGSMWTVVIALVVGAVATGFGGALGGLMPSRTNETIVVEETTHRMRQVPGDRTEAFRRTGTDT